jgi:hypothetical protein
MTRTVMTTRLLLLLSALLVVAGSAGCHRPKHYETDVEITRISPVRRDETGKVLTLDVEITYFDCPGTQIEVIRGDADFAACVMKQKVGDKAHVALDHVWTVEDQYSWIVRSIANCPRIPDPSDEASYSMVRECSDWLVNGQRVGFQCNYLPEQKLLAKCPWFRRR